MRPPPAAVNANAPTDEEGSRNCAPDPTIGRQRRAPHQPFLTAAHRPDIAQRVGTPLSGSARRARPESGKPRARIPRAGVHAAPTAAEEHLATSAVDGWTLDSQVVSRR